VGFPQFAGQRISRFLLLIVAPFVLGRSAVAQRGMETMLIVERFNVVKEVRPSIFVV
jgi:hypothetical protein